MPTLVGHEIDNGHAFQRHQQKRNKEYRYIQCCYQRTAMERNNSVFVPCQMKKRIRKRGNPDCRHVVIPTVGLNREEITILIVLLNRN